MQPSWKDSRILCTTVSVAYCWFLKLHIIVHKSLNFKCGFFDFCMISADHKKRAARSNEDSLPQSSCQSSAAVGQNHPPLPQWETFSTMQSSHHFNKTWTATIQDGFKPSRKRMVFFKTTEARQPKNASFRLSSNPKTGPYATLTI